MDKLSHITKLPRHMDAITSATRHMSAVQKAINPAVSFIDKFSHTRLFDEQLATMQKAINPAASFINKFSHTRLFDEQLAAMQKAISPSMKFMDKVTSMNRLNEQIAAFSKTIPDMSYAAAIPSYSFLNRQIESLTKSAINFEKFSFPSELALKTLNAFSYPSEKLETALKSYSNVWERYIPNNSFENTFKEVFRRINESDEPEAVGKIESVAEDLEAEAQKSFISLSSYRYFMDALAIIAFILTVLSFIQSKTNQDEGKSNIFEELSKVEERLMHELNGQLVQQPNFAYYVVLRAVRLKTKPHSRKGSKTITYLYQNQLVRLVEPKGKWIKVEYYNYMSGVHEQGWCMKKYLKCFGTIKVPQA